jgi:hypothetical protein
VAISTSEDCGPTAFGLKAAWNWKVLPACTVTGIAGIPEMTKLASPVKVTFEIERATLAVQVMVFATVAVLRLEVPNSVGDVQLSGRLTGEPKPYKKPLLVPR